MGCCIVKLAKNKYITWSTTVDAPISNIMTRDQVIAYYRDPVVTEKRLERADKNGHSMLDNSAKTAKDFIKGNRAGDKETELTLKQIIKKYK